jgi:hypothetical protein
MMRDFIQHLDSKIDDIIKVNAIGAFAFIVSWSDFDHWLRTLGLIAALVYTGLKIAQTIKEIRK